MTGSGPAVARLFQRLLALVFLDAWLSLAVQVRELVGSRGLLPADEWAGELRAANIPWRQVPTLFYWGVSDGALTLGVGVGVLLALVALGTAGYRWYARAAFALSTALYLSYVVVGRTFLSFQWDNLLLECGAFAVLLPTDRPARGAHLLFRLILFKLYWESGIAKWQSHLHDWHDGSAMTYYYETAPLPTWMAWYAHALPVAWHHFESRATLAFELVLPLGIFGPRRVRQVVAVFLTGFQVVNALTANYGFFCYLAVALHVFLLDDADVERAAVWLRRSVSPVRQIAAPSRGVGAAAALALFALVSLNDALVSFAPPSAWLPGAAALRGLFDPFRVINTYHLFGHITRERVEPEVQTLDGDDGATWTAHHFRHKPGDPARAPDFVAPHQPRVDFQLWFYGLSHLGGSPAWVTELLARVCLDPDAVRGLFERPLPAHPQAVRLVFWRYHFTTPAERRAGAGWWRRQQVNETRPITCAVDEM
jgi:hypothetical protein